MILNMIEEKNLNLKGFRTYVKTEKSDLNSKGNELLDELGINVSDVKCNKDILLADNFSATLIKKNDITKGNCLK